MFSNLYKNGGTMEKKIKHLEMIQSIITRMAQNSFMIKGWSLTLVVALFAFVPKVEYLFIPLAIVPIILFMCLDAYYFQSERRYRKLYDIERIKDESAIDFDLKISNECKDKNNRYISCLFSKSIMLFYVPLIIVVICIIIAIFI